MENLSKINILNSEPQMVKFPIEGGSLSDIKQNTEDSCFLNRELVKPVTFSSVVVQKTGTEIKKNKMEEDTVFISNLKGKSLQDPDSMCGLGLVASLMRSQKKIFDSSSLVSSIEVKEEEKRINLLKKSIENPHTSIWKTTSSSPKIKSFVNKGRRYSFEKIPKKQTTKILHSLKRKDKVVEIDFCRVKKAKKDDFFKKIEKENEKEVVCLEEICSEEEMIPLELAEVVIGDSAEMEIGDNTEVVIGDNEYKSEERSKNNNEKIKDLISLISIPYEENIILYRTIPREIDEAHRRYLFLIKTFFKKSHLSQEHAIEPTKEDFDYWNSFFQKICIIDWVGGKECFKIYSKVFEKLFVEKVKCSCFSQKNLDWGLEHKEYRILESMVGKERKTIRENKRKRDNNIVKKKSTVDFQSNFKKMVDFIDNKKFEEIALFIKEDFMRKQPWDDRIFRENDLLDIEISFENEKYFDFGETSNYRELLKRKKITGVVKKRLVDAVKDIVSADLYDRITIVYEDFFMKPTIEKKNIEKIEKIAKQEKEKMEREILKRIKVPKKNK